jgi:hypothetical protein
MWFLDKDRTHYTDVEWVQVDADKTEDSVMRAAWKTCVIGAD